MKNMLKKATHLVLAITVVTGLTACNEEDVVNGIIIGGIIGGIVGGGNVSVGVSEPTYTFLSDCEGYRREWVCEWSSNGWRRTYRRHYRPHGLYESASLTAAAPVQDEKAVRIQERWGLNTKSAAKLSLAIENAKGGDMNAFAPIGLGLRDLDTLLSKNQVDINDLANVAQKLQTSEKTALAILNAFTKEYNQQKTDVHSALWGQCVAKGQWKTPEAASCSSLDAAGCSPALGASNCLPL